MKLIFMGTPEFAVPSLKLLVEAGHDTVSVYTQPDKPKGRGHAMQFTPVKQTALTHNIPVYQPVSISNKSGRDAEIQNQIIDQKADCIVVVAYGKLLPKPILDAARFGCVNVHSSLLPKFRGAAPIHWAVLNGENVTGVTTMQLDEGMDTGDILLQSETPIGENETAGELHDRLAQMGAELIVETLEKLEKGEIIPVKQNDTQASYTSMLAKDMSIINWNRPANEIHNQIRGLQPWPMAETTLNGKRMRVHASRLVNMTLNFDSNMTPGTVLSVDPFAVACGKGALEITQIQADGGKRMHPADYFRGHPINQGEILV